MTRSLPAVAIFAFVLCLPRLQAQNLHPISYSSTTTRTAHPVSLSRPALPLVFEPNLGQADAQVRFLARGAGYTLFLTDREAVIAAHDAAPVRMRLVGANAPLSAEQLQPTTGISNYFLGNDPARWRTNIPHYRRIRYQGVYPGVDEVFYGNEGKLEYDLVVAPGADASQISMEYDGARSMHVDAHGDLVLNTDAGELRLQRPTVYQVDATGQRTQIAASFRLNGKRRVLFALARYDRQRALVIDPSVGYASYLGGSSQDAGNGIAVDSAGNAYVTGNAGSINFPVTNAFQAKAAGSNDAFVSKINPTGSALIYSTYIGGNGVDQANGIATDSAGNAYVTGTTGSANFPVQNALQPARKGTLTTGFVTKLDPTGSHLVYSTYLGGSASLGGLVTGDKGAAIAVDASGNAYVAGSTASADFPTRNALEPNFIGSAMGFVSKIAPDGSSLLYSTYLGGGNDVATGIALDSAGNVYVAGGTYSNNFPTTLNGPLSLTNVEKAYVVKINAAGTGLIYSMALGGNAGGFSGSNSSASGLVVDSAGEACITGTTGAANYPTKNALYPTISSQQSAFITKISASGAALVYSTYLAVEFGIGIAADGAGDVFVTGQRGSISGTSLPLQSPIQSTLAGAYVTAFSPDGSALLYSTYLGSGLTSGTAIAADPSGNAYVTGGTGSGGLPADGTAFQPTQNGIANAFVVKIALASNLVTTVNAASFTAGPVAPNSIASVFGSHLSTQTASATTTLGTSLGGTTVNVTDAKATTMPADIFFASSGQVNILIPGGLAPGTGQVQVVAGDGTISFGPLQISQISPGIFSADGRLAVGSALYVDGQGGQTTQTLVEFNTATAQFSPIPITLSATPNGSYLVLYGTGIRSALLSQVTIMIGNAARGMQSITPLFAGIQGAFAGLDQINLQIPASLAGAGDVTITLTANGVTSNAVHVTIQ